MFYWLLGIKKKYVLEFITFLAFKEKRNIRGTYV